MFVPLAVCIEHLDTAVESQRYLQCVTVPGGEEWGEKVLCIDDDGVVRWAARATKRAICELWSSSEERVALLRRPQSVSVKVVRGVRALLVPFEKPVLLLDGDELEIAIGATQTGAVWSPDLRYRLHIHGEAPEIHPPRWFGAQDGAQDDRHITPDDADEVMLAVQTQVASGETGGRRSGLARAAAAALALGTAVSTAGCPAKKKPQGPAKGGNQATHTDASTPPAPGKDTDGGSAASWNDKNPPDGGALAPRDNPPKKKRTRQRPPIEIRPHPPSMPAPTRRNRKP